MANKDEAPRTIRVVLRDDKENKQPKKAKNPYLDALAPENNENIRLEEKRTDSQDYQTRQEVEIKSSTQNQVIEIKSNKTHQDIESKNNTLNQHTQSQHTQSQDTKDEGQSPRDSFDEVSYRALASHDEPISPRKLAHSLSSHVNTLSSDLHRRHKDDSYEASKSKDIDEQGRKTLRLLGIFALIFVCFLGFFAITLYKAIVPARHPSYIATKNNVAIRGSIISHDGYNMAASRRLYKVSINTQSIDPLKKELFITLFSIYSGLNSEYVREKLDNNRGYIVLSYRIDEGTAANLKRLNARLLNLDAFREYTDRNGHTLPKIGIDIVTSGIARIYPFGSSFEPVLGYVRKYEDNGITKVRGVKGLEKYYNEILRPRSDGVVRGERDIGFNIILNKEAKLTRREDGYNLRLAIPFALQEKIELLLSEAKKHYKTKEIVAGIMDPKSGEMLALASSNRFDPDRILKNEYANLNISAVETSYEPGSTIKPLIYSLLLQKKRIKQHQKIYLENGSYVYNGLTITDDGHKIKDTDIENVIIKSSNIGMVKLTKDLDAGEMRHFFRLFGLGEITGIDLPYEASGILPPVKKMQNYITKATLSYGYGLRTTFIQLLRAYCAFSNGGYILTPHIATRIDAKDGKTYLPRQLESHRVLSKRVADYMHELLAKVVKDGTGQSANVKGLIVGGKTGTAKIAKGGRYIELYNGSFFGYVSDGVRTYTMGVVAYDSDERDSYYYGSKTAAPVFKKIVELLLSEKYLIKR